MTIDRKFITVLPEWVNERIRRNPKLLHTGFRRTFTNTKKSHAVRAKPLLTESESIKVSPVPDILIEAVMREWEVPSREYFNITTLNHKIEVVAFVGENPTDDKIRRLQTSANSVDWSLYNIQLIKRAGNYVALLRFEPCHPTPLVKFVDNTKLYHWTPERNVGRILSEGLLPKGSSLGDTDKDFLYPPRIYFLNTDKDEDIATMGALLASAATTRGSSNKGVDFSRLERYALFSVETSNLKDIGFYFDPLCEGAVFTEQKIVPEKLTLEIESADFTNFIKSKLVARRK